MQYKIHKTQNSINFNRQTVEDCKKVKVVK